MTLLMIILLEKVAPVPLFTDNFQRIFTIRTVVSHTYTYDRAKTLSFISLIRRKNTEFENESNV